MMNWVTNMVFRPYSSVMIVATILALSTLGCCETCEFSQSCTSIVLFEDDYTGQVQLPNMNNSCNISGISYSSTQTICLLSFDIVGALANQIADQIKTIPVSTSLPTNTSNNVPVSTSLPTNLGNNVLGKPNYGLFSEVYNWVVNFWNSKRGKRKGSPTANDGTPNEGTKSNISQYSLVELIMQDLNNSYDPYSNCTYKTTGLWLSKDINDTYRLSITRGNLRPNVNIFFMRGKCNTSWPQKIQENCFSASYNVITYGACNITCLNPQLVCNQASYISTTMGFIDNNDIIEFHDETPICFKYGSPFQNVEQTFSIGNGTLFQNDGSKTNKAEVMKNLTSKVLEMMGNKSTASVSVGEVQGIFVKPKDPTKMETTSFVYSNVTNLSIIQDESQMKTYPTQISIPKEAFEKAKSQNISTIFTAVFRFPSFTKDEMNSSILNGEVYSIDMGAEIANLTNTINITFKSVVKGYSNFTCCSWNGSGSKPNWTTDGCNTTRNGGGVSCECAHLTFFAVLMIPNADNTSIISNTDLSNLTYITSIGCGLSVFFLCVALFMHFLLRRARKSESAQILINLLVALVLLDLTFLTNEYVANAGNEIGCKLMAGFMHYCLLCTFTWFGLQALHLCLQLARISSPIAHYLIKVQIAGWAPPAIVVTVLFFMQKYNKLNITTDTGNSVSMCWITDPSVHYIVNIGYYSVIFAFTFTTFVVMLRWIVLLKKNRAGHKKVASDSGKHTGTGTSDILTIMGLCFTLGVTWGFAFFAYGALRLPSYYIFTILNSFQGFFLFIYYYKTSKFVGEKSNISGESSYTTEATQMENPYEKQKNF